MVEAFNPYREWLGIGAEQPNYYELLSLPGLESNPDRIAVAADRATTRVRSFRPGPNAAQWSRLLDEIRDARTCLLSINEKIDYDGKLVSGTLASPQSAVSPKPSISEIDRRADKPAIRPNDDAYPPGMGPAGGGRAKPEPEAPSRRAAEPTAPAPAAAAPSDLAAMLPPGISVPTPPAPAPAPTGYAGWPAANAPTAMPYGQYPAAGAPMAGMPAAQPYGMAMPMAGAPAPGASYGGAPMAMPLGQIPAGWPGGYPGAPAVVPMAAPYGQPMNPYGAMPYGGAAGMAYPMAMPTGYPAAYPPQGPPPAPPPSYGNDPLALASPLGMPSGYASAGMPLDPMAPYSVPGTASATGAPRVMGFAGGAEPLPVGTKHGIPMGTAVAQGEAIASGTTVASPAGEGAPGFRGGSSSAAVMAAKRAQASQRMLIVAGAGGALMLMTAVGIFWAISNNRSGEVAEAHPSQATKNSGDAATPPIERSVESALPVQGKTTIPPRNDNRSDNNPPNDKATMPTESPAPMPMPETPPMPEPSRTPAPAPTPTSEVPAPQPTPAPTPTSPPTPPPTPTPTPTPPPTPAPEATPMVTRQDAIKLGKALTTAKAALAEQNFEEADKQLAIAEPLAKLPEHQAKVARLKEVASYVQQFREAVAAAVAELDAGAVFKVGTSTQVAVVETFPDKIIVRTAGQNRTYPFQDLPPGLAAALADMKLDPAEPVNRVIKAAYLAVSKPDDEEVQSKARTWLEEAKLGGIDATSVETFMTDKYDELAKDVPVEGDKPAAEPAE